MLVASLVLALAAVAASSCVLTLRAVRLFRDIRRLKSSLADGLERIERSVARIDGHLDAASASGERLSVALARLRRSRARLAVLTAAIDDVRDSVSRVTAVYPRK